MLYAFYSAIILNELLLLSLVRELNMNSHPWISFLGCLVCESTLSPRLNCSDLSVNANGSRAIPHEPEKAGLGMRLTQGR